MQEKQGFSPLGVVLAGLAAMIAGAVVTLMARDVPAPQHAIVQPLDTKAFFGQKQP